VGEKPALGGRFASTVLRLTLLQIFDRIEVITRTPYFFCQKSARKFIKLLNDIFRYEIIQVWNKCIGRSIIRPVFEIYGAFDFAVFWRKNGIRVGNPWTAGPAEPALHYEAFHRPAGV